MSDEPALPAPAPDAPTVLVVDHSAADRQLVGRAAAASGWRVAYAKTGDEAAGLMAAAPPAVVLTALRPGADGLNLVERLRDEFPQVPVVLVTGRGGEGLAVAALRAGAASYVAKKNVGTDLPEILDQVLAASRTTERRKQVLNCLILRASRYVIGSDPSLVGPLVGVLRDELVDFGVCGSAAATRCGIALEEALLNAVYHGNLEVSSDLKRNDESAFHNVAAERRTQPPYKDRCVRVTARITPDRGTFLIVDEGPGFDVSRLPDPTDPANLLLPSGRGIVLMRMFMDEVSYNATGNRVVLIKRRPARG